MPPALSDSEQQSDSDVEVVEQQDVQAATPRASRRNGRKSGSGVYNEVLEVEKEDEKKEEGGEEEEEDMYTVEAIKTHTFDEKGNIFFRVKWEGYDSESDLTWENEETLQTAPELLAEYYESIGGRDYVLDEAAKHLPKGKKRGRASSVKNKATDSPAAEPASARKRRGRHPRSASPPASVKKEEKEFKPPSGSWEEDVKGIDACEGGDGKVLVYLTWRNGHKTQHALDVVYKRCPQKMLKFYESHLVFKRGGGTAGSPQKE